MLFIFIFLFILTSYRYKVKSLDSLNIFFSLVYSWFQRDVITTLTLKKQKQHNIFFVLFLFLLIVNLVGLLPFSDTLTMYVYVNLFFSLMTQLGVTIIGGYFNKYDFIRLFLPSNIPILISVLLVPIEVLSYVSRILSLTVRLFANMFAGHAVIKIIACFVWIVGYALGAGGLIWSLIPLTIFFLVLCLEVLVAMLQAYVFISLVLIYLRITLNPH